MIKSVQEYEITKGFVAMFEKSLAELDREVDTALARLERAALSEQLNDLRTEVKEWESRPTDLVQQ